MAKMVRPSELIPNPILSDGETLPHLTKEEFAVLKASVEAHGILQPIVVAWPERVIIDGHHRWRVALELKLETVPVTLDETHTADQQEELGIQLNAARRHWTREARETAIRRRLKRAPHRSDRDIASTLSVDGKTVAKYRAEMEATAEIPHFDFRQDKQGKKRPARTGSSDPQDRKPKTPAPPKQERGAEQSPEGGKVTAAPGTNGSKEMGEQTDPPGDETPEPNKAAGTEGSTGTDTPPVENVPGSGAPDGVPLSESSTNTAPAHHDAAGSGSAERLSADPVEESSSGASLSSSNPAVVRVARAHPMFAVLASLPSQPVSMGNPELDAMTKAERDALFVWGTALQNAAKRWDERQRHLESQTASEEAA